MAIQKEVWIADIQEALFQDNEFLLRSISHDQYVTNNIVHIPNAGTQATVIKNPSSYPLTASLVVDNDLTYTLALYALQPFQVPDLEQKQVNYDKRMSVMKRQINALNEAIGNNACYDFAPSSATTNGVTRIIRTTGAATSNALASGATGSRSAVTLSDIARLKGILDTDNVPANGRVLLVPASIYNSQLLSIPDIYQQQSYGQSALPNGVVARLYGFDVMVRPNVVTYTTGATPSLIAIGDNGVQTTSNTTDNLGIIAFHEDFVARAVGAIDVYDNEKQAIYLGALFNASVLFKGTKLRQSAVGVCALVQQ
jgi:hypothetical protein